MNLTSDCFYTTLCNAMDYPCTVFPVTYVDEKQDLPEPPHQFHNHEDEAVYKMCTSRLMSAFNNEMNNSCTPQMIRSYLVVCLLACNL